MKIKPEHYESMKRAIETLPRDKVLAHKEALKNDSRVKDLDKRFRWDCFDLSVKASWVCGNLYTYIDDRHIDTALRSIMKDLGI